LSDDLLDQARRIAGTWLRALPGRHVGPLVDASELRLALDRPLTDAGEAPHIVLDDLARDLGPGLVASGGPRYHGFVVGGALPVALAADWLVSAYDQMAGMHSSSPGMAVLEEIAAAWVLDALGLPASAGVGFVTGAQMANVTCLAVARNAVLAQEGWDAAANGLFGAPGIEVLVGEEVHVTVGRALRLSSWASNASPASASMRTARWTPARSRGRWRPAPAPRSSAPKPATSTPAPATRSARSPMRV
jgi:glutamate/tyrosine decarboxylase-like PLP-dependent enzyme